MKLIIVDDNIKFREGLKFFLETEFNFDIIGEASNGIEFLNLSNIADADVVLMDLNMPEKDGYEAAFEASEKFKNIKIVAITNQLEKVYFNHIMQSGFKACLSKEDIFHEIIPAIQKVIRNEYYISEKYN